MKDSTYYYQENKGLCSGYLANYQCDGLRFCDPYLAKCTGVSRSKSAAYYFNESNTSGKCPTNSSDTSYLVKDYYCDGMRTCSN